MNGAIITQLEFFLVSTLWGAIILFVYDGFRILRRVVKQNDFIIVLEDLVFWTFAGVFIFAMMYRLNDGIIRGYSVMGMTIGMVLYHNLFSNYIVISLTKLIVALLRPVIFVIRKGKRLIKKFLKYCTLQLKRALKSVKIILIYRKQKAIMSVKILREKKKQKELARQKKVQKKSARQMKQIRGKRKRIN
jgi:spore cortex biosynthesis protein YabQ